MRRIARFVRREPVLTCAVAAALASMAIAPPSAAYADYIDWNVLTTLFCLMCVVGGLRDCGLFERVSRALVSRAGTARNLAFVLVGLCFFASMLVTNDVALIAFVPLTLAVLGAAAPEMTVPVVALQTVAANLGSMATPIGNPQNLYLFGHYGLSIGAFSRVVLPLSAVSLALLAACCFLFPGRAVRPPEAERSRRALNAGRLAEYGALLALCLTAVFKLVPGWLCFVVTFAAMLALSRPILLRVDYALLATFAAFFVFVGNVSAAPAVREALGGWLLGREALVGAAVSQVVSNVPAALLLAPFTENAAGLLAGVNIGGLGTPVASLASLISLKLYARSEGANRGKYLRWFTAVNAAFLAALALAAWALGLA